MYLLSDMAILGIHVSFRGYTTQLNTVYMASGFMMYIYE